MAARDVAVVGCGPAGMAAALLLARQGHRVRLFERFATPHPLGSGLLLQPTGLAVLARLGIAGRIHADGARIDRLHGRALPSGRIILDVAYRDLDPAFYGVGIHRASLFDALFAAVGAEPIDLVTGVEIAGTEPAGDGRPTLIDRAGRRHGTVDLLVNASGARSSLRHDGSAARPFAYGALWTTLPLAGHAFDPATLAQVYRRASTMIGVMPLGRAPGIDGPAAAVFWSLRMDAVGRWRERGLGAWKAEIAASWPEAAALVEDIGDADALSVASYVEYPTGLRVAMIGDAAHATNPQLGQGAYMGLIDAAALADAVGNHRDVAAALAAYAAGRRRHVRFYQWASRWLTPLFQSDSLLGAWFRDIAFPAARLLPWSRRETVRTLAGLKTGLFSSLDAETLRGIERR